MKKYIGYWIAAALLLLLVFPAGGQSRSRGKGFSARQKVMEQNPFFHQQWWVGMKGGLTLAQAVPLERFSVLQPMNSESAADFEKEYLGYEVSRAATSIGLIGTYTFWRGLSVSLQPMHTNLKVGYRTSYLWEGEGINSVKVNQTHQMAISYLEIPLMFRYDLYKAKIRPYVQGGAFYGRLLKADKSMEVESFDAASGAADPISNTAPIIGAKELFIRTNLGWLAGAGINYELGSLRLGLEVNYKQGFTNVTDRRNRFADQRMVGVGDVMDDMELRNWEAAFTLLFPLKFLDTGSFVPAKP